MKLIATKGHYVFFYYVFSSFIPSPGDLPNPGIEPGSPALQADSLPSEPLGKPDLADCISTHSKNKWLYAHGCEKGEALLPLVSCL